MHTNQEDDALLLVDYFMRTDSIHWDCRIEFDSIGTIEGNINIWLTFFMCAIDVLLINGHMYCNICCIYPIPIEHDDK